VAGSCPGFAIVLERPGPPWGVMLIRRRDLLLQLLRLHEEPARPSQGGGGGGRAREGKQAQGFGGALLEEIVYGAD